MMDLTRFRHTLFALTGVFAFLLATILLECGVVFSASLGGGTELLYSIQANLSEADKLKSTVAQIDLATQDILGRSATVDIRPEEHPNSYRLSITFSPEEAIGYEEFYTLSNMLVNSFSDITFTPLYSVSRGYVEGIRISTNYSIGGVLAAGGVLLYILLRFRRLGSQYASVAVAIAAALNLLLLAAVYALFQIPIDAQALLSAAPVLGFSLYNSIGVFDRMIQNLADGSQADCAQALNRGIAGELHRLLITTLSVSAAMLTLTTAAYLNEVDRVIAFSFPLTVGLFGALYSSGILAPLIWFELKFWTAEPLTEEETATD